MRTAFRSGAFYGALLSLVLGLQSVSPAIADSRADPALLHAKVKSFSCSLTITTVTNAVKQGATSSESHRCDYRCVEDFNLTCFPKSDACEKLAAAHWDARRYDLSGRGSGSFVGLDVNSVMKGGIDRRSGALSFTREEHHSFQSDPIFIKSTKAAGTCQPDKSYTPRQRHTASEKKKPRRGRDWSE